MSGYGSIATYSRCPRNVRYSPDSDQIAALRQPTLRAKTGLMHCNGRLLLDLLIRNRDVLWR
jgi:hypothetical protein